MKTAYRTLITATLAGALLGACGTATQQKPVCLVAHGGFAAKYILKSNPSSCPTVLGGESYGANKYNDPAKATPIVAIQPEGTYWGTDPAAPGSKIAVGSLRKDEPDANDICFVENVSAASAGPGSATVPGVPAPTFRNYTPSARTYTFKNVQFYVTAAAPGNEWTADLDLTINGCTATYKVLAMAPKVGCFALDPASADFGYPIPADKNADGTYNTTPENCISTADPANGRPTGSGINPDFTTECSKSTGLYQLAGETFQISK